ncbi:MAG: hypothetical protein N2050_00075 [Flavobacteriales bacterium]|nr:hypothetical protein [Flavobacteriales bacterium]
MHSTKVFEQPTLRYGLLRKPTQGSVGVLRKPTQGPVGVRRKANQGPEKKKIAYLKLKA